MTTVAPMDDFPWGDDTYTTELSSLPKTLVTGSSKLYTFIMGTDRKTPRYWVKLTEELDNGVSYIHFRVRIVYKDVFGDEHEFETARVYGVRRVALGDIGKMLNSLYGTRSPEWYDSRYKYGQEEQ